MATESKDGTAVVWDAYTGEPITPPLSHDAAFLVSHQYQKLAFSPHGNAVVTAGSDGEARIWKISQSTPLLAALDDLLIVFGLQPSEHGTGDVPADLNSAWQRFASVYRDRLDIDVGQSGHRNHASFRELLRHAAEASKSENTDEAIRLASQAVETFAERSLGWRARARLFLQQGEWKIALNDYARAIELDPDQSVYYAERGWILAENGQIEAALEDLSKAIDLNSQNPSFWKQRAMVHQRTGDPLRAIEDFTKAIDLAPKDCSMWTNRGQARAAIEQWDQALADYSKSLELDLKIRHTRTWHLRGIANHNLGRMEDAIADLSKAISMNASEPTYWYNRGRVYAYCKEQEAASADFERYFSLLSWEIESNAENGTSWYRRGVAHTNFRNWEEALADFAKAIELGHRTTAVWQSRASCFAAQQKWNQTGREPQQRNRVGEPDWETWQHLAGAPSVPAALQDTKTPADQ